MPELGYSLCERPAICFMAFQKPSDRLAGRISTDGKKQESRREQSR